MDKSKNKLTSVELSINTLRFTIQVKIEHTVEDTSVLTLMVRTWRIINIQLKEILFRRNK